MIRRFLPAVLFACLLVIGSFLFSPRGPVASAQTPEVEDVTASRAPVGNGFTYQGRLLLDGAPTSERHDFQFSLYDVESGGTPLATLTRQDVDVKAGLFTVLLDFGAPAFDGGARWLEIAVRPATSADSAVFSMLSERQALTPVPYAMYAGNAANVLWNGVMNVPPGFADGVDDAGPQLAAGRVAAEVPPSTEPQTWTQAISFDEPFGEVPAVTLGLEAALPAGGLSPYIVSSSTTGVTLALAVPATMTSPLIVGSSDVNYGKYTSMAIVNGKPAISYVDGTEVMYVQALDAEGSSWGTPVLIATGPMQSGHYTSLVVVNGKPAISYVESVNDGLTYVRAMDADGSSWGTPVVLEDVYDVGWFATMAVVNGKPAISYFDVPNRDLKYVQAMDADGSSWNAPMIVDSEGWVGEHTSLAVVNGKPAITYLDDTNQTLKYVRATDADGSSWSTPVTLDSMGWNGISTSLVVVNGRPAVSYHDEINHDLKYVRATDADGSSWGTPATLDSEGDVGWYASLAMLNGRPAIGYYDATNRNLKYVQAMDADGSSWGIPATLDSEGLVGEHTSLVAVNGRAGIAYTDTTNKKLKYVAVMDLGSPSINWIAAER
jgi:hypothetical protein